MTQLDMSPGAVSQRIQRVLERYEHPHWSEALPDLHTACAAEIYGVDVGEVTQAQRLAAKQMTHRYLWSMPVS